MNVILFGASGMVGDGVLIECLDDPRVKTVLAIGRSSCGRSHAKLTEVIRSDFFNYDDALDTLSGFDACFFCLGVTSVGKSEQDYQRLTYDLTMAAATAIAKVNDDVTFCYVSGQGCDSSEQGRVMWARVKGKTENHLMQLFNKSYMFRPGYIQPMKGVHLKKKLYKIFYGMLGPLYPLWKRLIPRYVTTTANVGRAMIVCATKGYQKRILENADINALSTQ